MITTQVVGNIFVIVDPNGDLQTVVGGQTTLNWIQIYTLLRGTFGDDYDFLSCYLDTGSGVINLGDASGTIYQDATGIGRWTFNFRSDWATAKLQHYCFYSFFNLTALLHEPGHRWLGYVNYATAPNTPAQHLLHQDWIWTPGGENAHWGRWPDDQNSCMDYDQAEWIDNGNGTFNRIDRDPTVPAQDQWFGYSPLDQYLMGLLPTSEVPDFKVVQNPSPTLSELGPYGVPTGPYTPSPAAVTVTIAQVQNTRSDEPASWSGPRNPNYLNSQRVFHEAVVIITKNSSFTSTFITNSDTWRRNHTANFRRVTSGRAMVDTSLLRSNYADLYVKDNPADVGTGTSSPPFWLSPDLWVRNADDGGLSDEPTKRGQSNWIHVRVRNKGAQPYDNVTVNFYLANFLDLVPGTEFLYPVDWAPGGLLGTFLVPSVPAASGGVEGEAIAKIEWTADKIPPATGWHPCLLAEVIPMEVAPSGLHHVFENRKLAQRNITILDPTSGAGSGGAAGGGGGAGSGFIFNYEFVIGHALRQARGTRLRLRAERHVPDVRLFLDPAGLVEGLDARGTMLEWDIPLDATRVPSADHGVQFIPVPPPPRTVIPRGRAADGLTVGISRGTEFSILPDPQRSDSALWLRFEDDVRVRIGGSAHEQFAQRYGMRGLRPVVLNGLPLLEVADPRDAGLWLPLAAGEKRRLRLLGVVSRSATRGVLYHITEELGDRVLGGVTVQVGI